MNFSDYDKALLVKLKEVFPNVVNASQEKALEYSEDSKASVSLPLISFWRLSNPLNNNFYNSFGTLRGHSHRIDKAKGDALMLQEIPFTLTYQIDIWSDRLEETDAILSEVVLFLQEEPHIIVKEPNVEEGISVSLAITDIDLNIDLSEFTDTGKLYQQVITIEIDKASIFYPSKKRIVQNIPLRTVLVDRGGTTDVED